MNYVNIECVNERGVQQYLDKGWEIIEVTKEIAGPNETILKYHIGYSATKRIADLLGIIEEYENRGLKDQLFEMVAEENGEKADDFIAAGGLSSSPTAKFFSKYDSLVKNRNVYYSEKRMTEFPEF